MKKIYFLGECMVELRSVAGDQLQQSFAGDVYNSAVYLKRCFPDIHTYLITVVGNEQLSSNMLAQFEEEQLDTRYVYKHPNKASGLYFIELDDFGERRFTYWRSESAAREINNYLDEGTINELAMGDVFFFSGISLAIVAEHAKTALWEKLKTIKSAGVKIAFDPNYRERLWSDAEQAKAQFHEAFRLADIVLPGVEDLEKLYDVKNAEQALEFCLQYKPDEVVVKNGPSSVVTYASETTTHHQITPVENVIDTTSAGDAFNGTYLGARLHGKAVDAAVNLASTAAGFVIQHHGAIAPRAPFKLAMLEAGL